MLKKKHIILLLIALGAGVLWFAFTQEWLIFNLPFGQGVSTNRISTTISSRKKVAVYLPKQGSLQREEREILWGSDNAINAEHLVAAWLNMLEDEQALAKKTSLQTVAAAHDGRKLLISFDRPPLNKNGSIAEKWLFIEALLKSIHVALPDVTHILFLVDHKTIIDPHLDFSRTWPASGFFNVELPVEASVQEPATEIFTLMIDPAGDSQKTGRVIGDSFERSITFACAHALKEELEKNISHLRVVITREPGEIAEQLQSANFSNKLHANLFIALTCFQETPPVSTCALYHVLYDPITDLWYKKTARTDFDPYFCAHCTNLKTTLFAIKELYDALIPYRQKGLFHLSPYRGLPCKPLVGVQAPAICCDMGLNNPDGWRIFIGPLVDSIGHVIESLRNKPASFF